MSTVLVAYATKYGSTEEIARIVASTLMEKGVTVDAVPAKDVASLERYSAVILGAALYNHKWHRDMVRFVSQHARELQAKDLAVFAVGPVNRDPYEFESARAQLDEVLSKWGWLSPASQIVLGGRFDPTRLKFPGAAKMLAKVPANDAVDPVAIKTWAESLPYALSLDQPALAQH